VIAYARNCIQAMNSVTLKIDSCADCPRMRQERHYTADSFETVFEWHCIETKSRRLISILDWNDPPPPIPAWCPLREKK
jgi:hypothetical protein